MRQDKMAGILVAGLSGICAGAGFVYTHVGSAPVALADLFPAAFLALTVFAGLSAIVFAMPRERN